MKNLIQKILSGKGNLDEVSSSCKSSESNPSVSHKMTSDTRENRKKSMRTRYDKIDEESSYIGSDSLNTSEFTDRISKDDRTMTINKEITYGDSDGKENSDRVKVSHTSTLELRSKGSTGKMTNEQSKKI